ncbi:signal transduction histidine kinase [Pullulanibacillus pueri]|nr:signal transduction histidine kinase [Pullulanibacillus pueri]
MTKLILLLYLAITYTQSQNEELAWSIFSLLIYFCLNILIYIVKNKKVKNFILLLSLLFILGMQKEIYPSLIFLLPIGLFEFLSYDKRKGWIALLISFLPEFIISERMQIQYGFVTLVSFLVFQMASLYSERITSYIAKLDKLRKDMQRLSKNLNENQAYIKQQEYTSKLEERNRLSQEIHDSIGHSMTGALIQMEAAKSIMESHPEKAAELLQNAINISKEGIESIRKTLKNMKPQTEQLGINRLRLLIDEFSSKHNILAPFTYKGNMDKITPIQWKVILENTGECLTNILKYANATRVSIDIQVLNKFIRLEIKDNGGGVEKVKKGLGIIGMEERTAAINGTIIVDGSNGFSVTTLLPLMM